MGNFEGKAAHCKVQGHSAVNCAKTAEPIKMPFGLWALMGPRNCIRWGLDPPWEGAILRGNGMPRHPTTF